MAENGNVETALQDIDCKIGILADKRQLLQQLRLGMTLAILGLLVFFILQALFMVRGVETAKVMNLTASSIQIQQMSRELVRAATQETLPKVQHTFMRAFLNDAAFVMAMRQEMQAFLTVFRNDISEQLAPEYARLVENQKKHLYRTFPEIQDHSKVERAIRNTMEIGGPLLQETLKNKFEAHIHSLSSIYLAAWDLQDESLSEFPSLEQATLGVTLELFGALLREEGEGSHE